MTQDNTIEKTEDNTTANAPATIAITGEAFARIREIQKAHDELHSAAVAEMKGHQERLDASLNVSLERLKKAVEDETGITPGEGYMLNVDFADAKAHDGTDIGVFYLQKVGIEHHIAAARRRQNAA